MEVTYIEQERIQHCREQFLRLLQSLEEVRSLEAESERRIEQLMENIKKASDVQMLNHLQAELLQVRRDRQTLSKDIEKQLAESEELLRSSAKR